MEFNLWFITPSKPFLPAGTPPVSCLFFRNVWTRAFIWFLHLSGSLNMRDGSRHSICLTVAYFNGLFSSAFLTMFERPCIQSLLNSRILNSALLLSWTIKQYMSVISKWSFKYHMAWSHSIGQVCDFMQWGHTISYLLWLGCLSRIILASHDICEPTLLYGESPSKIHCFKGESRQKHRFNIVWTHAQPWKCTAYQTILQSNLIQFTNTFSMLSKMILSAYILIIINIQNYQTRYLDCCLSTQANINLLGEEEQGLVGRIKLGELKRSDVLEDLSLHTASQ